LTKAAQQYSLVHSLSLLTTIFAIAKDLATNHLFAFRPPMHVKPSGWSQSLSGIGTTPSSSTKWTEDYAMPSLPNEGLEDLNREDASEDGDNFDNILISPNSLSPTNDAVLPPPAVASSAAPNSRKHKKSARIDSDLRIHWARFRRRLGSGTSPSTSSIIDGSIGNSSSNTRPVEQYGETDEVNEVVVDRNWLEDMKSSISPSEQAASPEKMGSHQAQGTDHDSIAAHPDSFWESCFPLIILRWRLYPAVVDFFSLRFFDEKAEAHYNKENWFMRKVL